MKEYGRTEMKIRSKSRRYKERKNDPKWTLNLFEIGGLFGR